VPEVAAFTNVALSFSSGKIPWRDKTGHPLFLVLRAGNDQRHFDAISVTTSEAPPLKLENASFEYPQVGDGGWIGSAQSWFKTAGVASAGVLAMADAFGGIAGGEMPSPAAGRQAGYVDPSTHLFQDIDIVRDGYLYTLTVAHGRRAGGNYSGNGLPEGSGFIALRGDAWDGLDIVTLPIVTPSPGTFVDRTLGFATTNGLNANAVGTHLVVVLGSDNIQNVFDNVRYTAQRPSRGVSLTGMPLHENVATDGELTVTGNYLSETDGLTEDTATGSVVLSQSLPAPTCVMLWLTGGDAIHYAALAQALSEASEGVDVLTVPDHDWSNLAAKYGAFDMLLKFHGTSDIAFNWDFGDGYAWDGTVVDKVAVSTKIITGTLLLIN
jgi:hypothetical protein